MDNTYNQVQEAGLHVQPSTLESTFRESYRLIHLLQQVVFEEEIAKDIFTVDYLIKEYASLLHEEVEEMKKEVNCKKHKPKKHVDIKALKKEIADILIYVSAISGFIFESEDELIRCMREKVEENRTRQDWAIKQRGEDNAYRV